MKIKVKKVSYEQSLQISPPKRKKPLKQLTVLRLLVKLLSALNLWRLGFKYEKVNMEKTEGMPSLVLMNHSSFVDLEIASCLLWKKPFSIVCTVDAFVGLSFLLRLLGCIPTKKFVSDPALISNIKYALHNNKSNVLMYPEASYSFDGTATALPRKLGLLLKKLDVPVCMIKTEGAFSRQPLYNCLKIRKVPLSAKMECILSREEVREKTVEELDRILDNQFTFDHFRWQQENKIEITENFRAEGLERILFKCPHCLKENCMQSDGILVMCSECGIEYELDIYGYLKCLNGETIFNHIPDWYAWQRSEVVKEIENNSYYFSQRVKVLAFIDYKIIYDLGEGILTHSADGFKLCVINSSLDFSLPPTASYGLYADYYWYEIADVIGIGNTERLYYCLPENNVSVAKVRMATEELFKIKRAEKRLKRK